MKVTYVFDTGPLSVFARSQWLGALKAVVQDSRALIPDVVSEELAVGVGGHHYLRAVQEADWLEVVPVELTAAVVEEGPAWRRRPRRGELIGGHLPQPVEDPDVIVMIATPRGSPARP